MIVQNSERARGRRRDKEFGRKRHKDSVCVGGGGTEEKRKEVRGGGKALSKIHL